LRGGVIPEFTINDPTRIIESWSMLLNQIWRRLRWLLRARKSATEVMRSRRPRRC
jgi:hypothetical protein